jgi:DNA-binding MarR family transcriptional regulator
VRLNVVVDEVLERITGSHGITPADYLVLAVVRRSPHHRSSPTAICGVLGRTTGGMSLALDRLAAAGWLRRLPDPSDRRRVVVEATEDGVRLATEVNTALHDWEASLGTTPIQRERIGRALAQLTGAIRQHIDDGTRF